jgi:exonuclease VII small subunit
MNEWRSKDPTMVDFRRLAEYEDQLVQWLISEKTQAPSEPEPQESPGTSRLIMKVMTKKLNEKYAGVLNESQRALIKAYAFSSVNDDKSIIQRKLHEVRDELNDAIDAYTRANPQSEYLLKKLKEAREQLLSENLDSVDDETMTRFMLYLRLHNELGAEE